MSPPGRVSKWISRCGLKPPDRLPQPTLRPVLDLNDVDAVAQWLAENEARFEYNREIYS